MGNRNKMTRYEIMDFLNKIGFVKVYGSSYKYKRDSDVKAFALGINIENKTADISFYYYNGRNRFTKQLADINESWIRKLIEHFEVAEESLLDYNAFLYKDLSGEVKNGYRK